MKLGWMQNIRESAKFRVIVRCLDCNLASIVKAQEVEILSCPFCGSTNLKVLSYSTIRKENEERTNQTRRTRWTYRCPSCGSRIFSISPVPECPVCHSRELIIE